MTGPLVVKFGGDALATPERIAAAAHRVAARRRLGPVVAVASARRGVTDHLLGLVEQVRDAVRPEGGRLTATGRAAADRAVASGELVAASLLAAALEGLGIPAAVLDAREAGLQSDGHAGEAGLIALRPARLVRLLARGITPVVTGFQGWHRGRITTLGRGGSDITAVALAAALQARSCELVKDPGALHTADPRLVPEARPIREATHRFVTELALAGARVIHHTAATRAERDGVRLRFSSLRQDGSPVTDVVAAGDHRPPHAVVLGAGHHGLPAAPEDAVDVATVSVVTGDSEALEHRSAAGAAAARAGATVLRIVHRPHVVSFLVPAVEGSALLHALHAAIGAAPNTEESDRRVSAGRR